MKKDLWVKEVQEEVEDKQEKEKRKHARVAYLVKAIWNLYSYTPPEGLFTESPSAIANQLKKDSDDLKQAMSRLNFYINRAGGNLSSERQEALEKAKDVLRSLYKEKEADLHKESIGRPPKEWWDDMMKQVKKKQPSYSEEIIRKTVGDIWYNKLPEDKKRKLVKRYEH